MTFVVLKLGKLYIRTEIFGWLKEWNVFGNDGVAVRTDVPFRLSSGEYECVRED